MAGRNKGRIPSRPQLVDDHVSTSVSHQEGSAVFGGNPSSKMFMAATGRLD